MFQNGKRQGEKETEVYFINEFTKFVKVHNSVVKKYNDELDELFALNPTKLSKEIYEVTAYTLRKEECGKDVNDPKYGQPAISGRKEVDFQTVHVQQWRTIAASKSIPFGTRIYIPYFKDKLNGGVFVVEDRGGAIIEGHLDVYMEDLDEALEFGRRKLEAYILE